MVANGNFWDYLCDFCDLGTTICYCPVQNAVARLSLEPSGIAGYGRAHHGRIGYLFCFLLCRVEEHVRKKEKALDTVIILVSQSSVVSGAVLYADTGYIQP